jgi:Ca2+-binding RTX toxin-like protein
LEDANMNSISYTGLGGLFFMALLSHSAAAACPPAFASATCNGGSGGAVCVKNADNDIDCDLGAGTVIDTDADAWFVSPTSTSFRAYGTEGDGEAFCCEFSGLDNGCAGNPISIDILGTDYDDTIRLIDSSAGTELDCSNATVMADAGADDITGSPSVNNYDHLYGEDDSDVIRGLNGQDYISGGYGYDLLLGGAGNDTIEGGYGDDHIQGGDGQDDLDGGEDTDIVCGGDGADTLDGGAGDDDEVTGEDGVDVLNAGGADGGDICEPQNSDASCEDTTTYAVDEPCPF